MGQLLDEVGEAMEKEENEMLDKLMRLHDVDEDGFIALDEFATPKGRDKERRREAAERERRREEEARKEKEEEQEEDGEDGDDDEGEVLEEGTAQTNVDTNHTEL